MLLSVLVLIEVGFALPALWIVAVCLLGAWLVGFPTRRRGMRWYRWR